MTIQNYGPNLHLPLQSQYQAASGIELIRDGFCMEAGTAAWTCTAVPSKVAVAAGSGPISTMALRVTGTAGQYALQNLLTIGKLYRVRVSCRGNGVGTRLTLNDNGGRNYVIGLVSATWQTYDAIAVAMGPLLVFYISGADGYFEVTDVSVQEVVWKTLDVSDYCASQSFLCSTRGGAQECLSLVKLENVDRHTGAVSTVADFSASPGAGAVYTLPVGWTYACASAGRTTQTSASTLVSGIAANAAPWRSVDGVSGGVSDEKQSTNICLQSNAFTTAPWGSSGGITITPNATIGPDGVAGSGWRIAPTLATDNLKQAVTVTASTTYTVSLWIKQVDVSEFKFRVYNMTAPGVISEVNITAQLVVGEWRRISLTFTTPAGCTQIYTYAYYTNGVPTGSCYIYGHQLELGAYPTSYIPTVAAAVTRAAATLTVPLDVANTFSGKIPRVSARTHFAYNESTTDAMFICDSRGCVYFEQSTQRFVYEVRGRGRIQSLPCTFSRDQLLVVRGDLDESNNLMTLIVSGCTTGDGTYQSYADSRKGVLLGDGSTAASIPTQLAPRGVQNLSTSWMQALGKHFDPASDYSIVALVTLDMAMLGGRIMSRGDYVVATNRTFDWYVNGATGDLHFVVGGVDLAASPVTTANDMRYTVGVTITSALLATVYVNGVARGSATMGTPVQSALFKTFIGDLFRTGSPNYRPWRGKFVSSFRGYYYALNATQMAALHDELMLEANR